MLGATNDGGCPGPVWLNDRVMTTSMPSSAAARTESISCASLLSP